MQVKSLLAIIGKVQAKMSLHIIKHYIMKAHGRMEVKLHASLGAGLDRSGQHHFTPGETPKYALARRPGQSDEEETFLSPAGNRILIPWWCIL